MLEQLEQDLWVVSRPLRLIGINAGSRMTVVRLNSDELFLHSPVRLIPALRDALAKLGQVRYVVAPNLMHHMFIRPYQSAYSGARFFAAPGLKDKRKDVAFTDELTETAPAVWSAQLDQVFIEGAPQLNETAFLHKPSRTLILTDLAFNFQNSDSAWTDLFFRLNDVAGRFGPSRLARYLLFRDKKAMRRSIEKILAWDFDRIIVSHGSVLDRGGKDQFKAAFRWLLS